MCNKSSCFKYLLWVKFERNIFMGPTHSRTANLEKRGMRTGRYESWKLDKVEEVQFSRV